MLGGSVFSNGCVCLPGNDGCNGLLGMLPLILGFSLIINDLTQLKHVSNSDPC